MENKDDRDLNFQSDYLIEIISKNSVLYELLNGISCLKIPEYYVGAGCIAQTVWNYLSGFPLLNGINDIDIAFFDDRNLSDHYENEVAEIIKKEFSGLNVKLDIKNQARVHLWYKEYFGQDIRPITSIEDAIGRWPTTATAVGVRKENDKYSIVAPFGLDDIFRKIVRANKTQITKDIYENKVRRWRNIWKDLKIIGWDE